MLLKEFLKGLPVMKILKLKTKGADEKKIILQLERIDIHL